MLLYRKPLSEIAVGESFQVTVTREDWKRARLNTIQNGCAISAALGARMIQHSSQ